MHQITSNVSLAARTQLSRNTVARALRTREPTPMVLQALHDLGARPDRLLVAVDQTAPTNTAA
ncbi:transcriptional regulator [Corynebacterium heidelbergense]|uniref:Transcriptional regulator n=2 Tax=Corynebacterium heidelbergense TaxID=2055947 RepID=A0A364VDT4_9CORY|nr:transcriptional regulator [Corynebacterium heidelbergense]